MVTAGKLKQLLPGLGLPATILGALAGILLLVFGYGIVDASSDVTNLLHSNGASTAVAVCGPALRETACTVYASPSQIQSIVQKLGLRETQALTWKDVSRRREIDPRYEPTADEDFLLFEERSTSDGADTCRSRPDFQRGQPVRVYLRRERVAAPGWVLSWIILYHRSDTGQSCLRTVYGYG